MKQADCIFCKIVAGDIPANKIYEDELLIVILDAFPAQEGHSLVIPKEHAADLLELPDAIAANVLPVAKKVMNAMENELKPHGYSIVQNNKQEAGQEVFHYHLHIIPRYSGRGGRGSKYALHPKGYKYTPLKDELKEVAKRIVSRLG
jgi:histidine triad (HIT) family protein